MSIEVNRKNIIALDAHLTGLAEEMATLKDQMATNANRIGTLINEIAVLKQGVQMTLAKQYGSGSTVVDNGD